MRFGQAWHVFWKTMFDADFAKRLAKLELPAEAKKEEIPAKATADYSLKLLGLLQRDGRLIDFLEEEIAGYSDEQIGAAVREVHRDCRATLRKYVTLAPVVESAENSTITVPTGFDPSRIKLVGKVSGNPPFQGTVVHRGWQVSSVQLPATNASVDSKLIAPAEIEL